MPTVTVASSTSQFPDVAVDHWGYEFVIAGVESGIINGYEDGTFRPSNKVTQAEMVKMLVSALTDEPVIVPAGEVWFMPYYTYADDNAWYIPSGAKDEPISRSETALIIANLFNPHVEDENDAIQFLLDTGLSEGKSSATVAGYEGADTLTRAEAIKFVMTVLDYSVEITRNTEEEVEQQEEADEEETDEAETDETETDEGQDESSKSYVAEDVAQKVAEYAGLDTRKSGTVGNQIYDKNIFYTDIEQEYVLLTITDRFSRYNTVIATGNKMDETIWDLIEFILRYYGFVDEKDIASVKHIAFSKFQSSLTVSNDRWIIKPEITIGTHANSVFFRMTIQEINN